MRGVRIFAVAVAVAAAIAVAPAAAQDLEAANEALKKGDLTEAKAQLEQAVKRDPADYNAALSYLSTVPPGEALKQADALSRAAGAPGWAKAGAVRVSGDHFFLREEYKKAADAYLQASKLDSALMYKHLYALAIAMDGQTEPARAVWNAISQVKSNELSVEAARLLALLPKPAPEPTVAAPVVQSNSALAQTQIIVPATTQNSALTQTQITTPAPRQNGALAQTQIAAPAIPVITPPEPAFTIQVGAFAAKENADNLVKRLSGKYEDITTSVAITNDQTLYRVRVGTFTRREEAVAYADKLIIEAGLSARVVEK
jgi:cell division septation protein DedD